MIQEVSKVSPNHIQSLEVSSNTFDGEVHDNMKSITEKLSAALSNISAKEELVKQHAKVAEEAVSGKNATFIWQSHFQSMIMKRASTLIW